MTSNNASLECCKGHIVERGMRELKKFYTDLIMILGYVISELQILVTTITF